MILIFSDRFDISTTRVQKHLDDLGQAHFRLNSEDFNQITFKTLINPKKIFIKDIELDIDSIKTVWLRKWSIPKLFEEDFGTKNSTLECKVKLNLIQDEFIGFSNFIFSLFRNKKGIIHDFIWSYSKLIQLNEADKVGLKTPRSFIANKINDIPNGHVTKPIERAPDINTRFYSSLIDDKIEDESTFFPSLIQEKIIKRYEIRVFFLDNTFYNVAMIPQESNIHIDSRHSSSFKNFRHIPYSLPKEIESKLKLLMKNLKLKIGAIDLIKDSENNYVFLEVNPNGQFGFYSKTCNFNLELKIAKYLWKENK